MREYAKWRNERTITRESCSVFSPAGGVIAEIIALAPSTGARFLADYYLEDFELGCTYTSPTQTISEEEALAFARRYDPQYFHLDPVAARDSVFGGIVLGGFQTAALAWTLVLATGMFDKSAMAGIGLDELRWHKPVRPGDSVRCEFTLIEARASRTQSDRGVARFRYEVKNQLDEIVLSLVIIQMLRRRPAGEPGP
jgi:acyl dehydratase